MVQAYFLNTVTNVLGLSVSQREVLSDDGYDTIYNIIHWKYDEICEWCATKYKLATNRGGATCGYRKINFIQELEWLATDLTLWGK